MHFFAQSLTLWGIEDANFVDFAGGSLGCGLVGQEHLYEYTGVPSDFTGRQGSTITPFLLRGKQQLRLHGVSALQSLSWFALMLVIMLPV